MRITQKSKVETYDLINQNNLLKLIVEFKSGTKKKFSALASSQDDLKHQINKKFDNKIINKIDVYLEHTDETNQENKPIISYEM